MNSLFEESSAKGAILSDDGAYRYHLWRDTLNGDGTCAFLMLNPSTADAEKDDPTIRKCVGFARRWGYRYLVVQNLYAYRATLPADLVKAQRAGIDVIGPSADGFLTTLATSDIVVCAWGSSLKTWPERWKHVHRGLKASRIVCLGINEDGAPKHPLYRPYDSLLLPFGATQ